MRAIKNILFLCDPRNRQSFWYSEGGIFITTVLFLLTFCFAIMLLGRLMFVFRDPCSRDMPMCLNEQKCANGNLGPCFPTGFLMFLIGILLIALFIGGIYSIYFFCNIIFRDFILSYNKANEVFETSEYKKTDEIININ